MKLDWMRIWYQPTLHPVAILLLPLSFLFFLAITVRRWFYRCGLLKTSYFHPPVIVVGNLTVGGTGKTPFVIALANFLKTQGYTPGIVSRGVGGKKHTQAHFVTSEDLPAIVGDEAKLLLENARCPVVIGIHRADAVRLLLTTNCNIVICDDGLQHYALDRDIEIVMVDPIRQFGNQCLLPAGPLREKKSRLKSAHFVVMNGGDTESEHAITRQPVEFVSVTHPDQVIPLAEFPQTEIHAVAAIGHPQQFFQSLQSMGFENLRTHTFPDHHLYQPSELNFGDTLPIVMTEKDAVKCRQFADHRFWYLRETAHLNPALSQAILKKIQDS